MVNGHLKRTVCQGASATMAEIGEDLEMPDCVALDSQRVPCGILLLTQTLTFWGSVMDKVFSKPKVLKILSTSTWFLAIFSLVWNFRYVETSNTFFSKEKLIISWEFYPLVSKYCTIQNSSFTSMTIYGGLGKQSHEFPSYFSQGMWFNSSVTSYFDFSLWVIRRT